MRFFKKIYPLQPLILSNGKGFKFPITESGYGLFATEDQKYIAEFKTAEAQRVGGVEEISAKEFEDLKKKAKPQQFKEEISPTRLLQAKVQADEQARAAGRAAERKIEPVSRDFHRPQNRINSIGSGGGFKPGTIDRP